MTTKRGICPPALPLRLSLILLPAKRSERAARASLMPRRGGQLVGIGGGGGGEGEEGEQEEEERFEGHDEMGEGRVDEW